MKSHIARPDNLEPIYRETVAEYLARGGTITRGMPATGIHYDTHEFIDRLLGAAHDDAVTQRVSAFNVDSDIRSAIDSHDDDCILDEE